MSAPTSAHDPSDRPPEQIRRVSVVAPMFDEAENIEGVVADIAAQDFDGELELLVADGRSTDGSVELLRAAGKRHGLEVVVIDNPHRWVSHGLNACVRAAEGELVVRIDCHSRYPRNYVRRCVEAAAETGADNVGGVITARGSTPTQRAVACAMVSAFGGIGWSRHDAGEERVEVDTVPFGAFRPRAFRRVGLFDETLVRNQDDEFNLRLRLAGGRIVRDPSIRLEYRPRGTFRGLFRQYYEYGRWKVPVMLKHRRIVSLRSLAPAALVASFAMLTILSIATRAPAFLLAGLGSYAVGSLVFGVLAIRARGESWRLLPRVVAAFPTIHLAYGLGMGAGTVRAAVKPARSAWWDVARRRGAMLVPRLGRRERSSE